VFDWQAWQKTMNYKHSLWQYIKDDQAAFLYAVLLTAASYIALPELGQIEWVRTQLGFTPEKTPLGALVVAFTFCQLGYQFREWFMHGAPAKAEGT
jgi:hypothetical protein